MKLYDYTAAPNPRRARIFIAEKGLQIETVQVDIGPAAEQHGEAFLAINPRATVPVLELDDGTRITENNGIAAYLEALNPDPPLLGTTPEEKGMVAAWQSHVEIEGLRPVADAFRNGSKGFVGRATVGTSSYEQIAALAERGRAQATEFFAMLDQRLGESEYLAGARFSIADITALVAVDFAGWIKLGLADDQKNAQRWYDAVSKRPSASA